ncbi:uncharacterized protein LOC120217992 [Hibiscus syriacus]|uniref:uncharacterized protein LOC120217992 n=1 Tax=Hibiscus syriacus TaxID=106335 RepID=UPI001923944B|nr:uncharacterized protein LOC120217992 [Hibiscus syriacus]
MDVLGVRQRKSNKKHSKRRNSNRDIKVVYISSPMKVMTCASQFRALVQELTGKDSDAAVRFMDDDDNVSDNSPTYSSSARVHGDGVLGLPCAIFNHGFMFESFDDELISEGDFSRMLTSNLSDDPSHIDTFRSFGPN